MWTMRLRRTGCDPWKTRRCAAALTTAATFDHMPTAFDMKMEEKKQKRQRAHV